MVFKYSPARDNPTKGANRAKMLKKVSVSLGGLAQTEEYKLFSTSNPMWRPLLKF